jgi:hypothetical protein
MGTYQAPIFSVDEKTKSVPVAPSNFKSRIAGSSVLISVDVSQKVGAVPTNVFLFSTSLGIAKKKPLQGEIIASKALIEIPLKPSMAGKKYLVTIYLSNSKGDSKPLTGTVTVPALPKNTNSPQTISVPPKSPAKTIICMRTNQTRAFLSDSCPPGWSKK